MSEFNEFPIIFEIDVRTVFLTHVLGLCRARKQGKAKAARGARSGHGDRGGRGREREKEEAT
jgi:hypothetical protein